MAARKRYRVKQLPAEEVGSMLASGQWVRDTSRPEEIHRGTDGRVLVVAGGSGTLFESAAEFEELYGALTAVPRARSAIAEKWSSTAPDDVPALIERLARALAVTSDRLDYSTASLDLVDSGILGLPPKERWALFEPVTAYVGEVIARAIGARWEMRENHGTREPWLVDPRGREIPPFMYVLEDFEKGRRGSVRGAVTGLLAALGARA